jgi:hypothetical protein
LPRLELIDQHVDRILGPLRRESVVRLLVSVVLIAKLAHLCSAGKTPSGGAVAA